MKEPNRYYNQHKDMLRKIFIKWAKKQPDMNHKEYLIQCAVFCETELWYACKKFKEYYNKQRECECGCITAYTIGFAGGKYDGKWYCIPHQPRE